MMMLKGVWISVLFCYALLPHGKLLGQTDTLVFKKLEEVEISGHKKLREIRSVVPMQTISSKQIQMLGAKDLGDVARHFSGVSVKDYGGIGGIKTISMRSLGAHHTGISYDGIPATDCQTGQMDLSRFSLQQVGSLSVSHGQSDHIFVPARELASAGVVHIQTAIPAFPKGRKSRLMAQVKVGSWDMVNPSFVLEQKVDTFSSFRFHGEWMSSQGDYPFTLRYGGADALVTEQRRSNTRVENFRFEGDYFHNRWAKWRIKAYFFQSDRGLPKATTYYNLDSKENLMDRQAFVQARMEKKLNERWKIQTSAKVNYSYNRYNNPITVTGSSIDNRYRQGEIYWSGMMNFLATEALQLNFSTDAALSTLKSDNSAVQQPFRSSVFSSLASKYVHERFTLSASVLHQWVHETGASSVQQGDVTHWSPYVGVSVKPFGDYAFYVRYFYKDIIRVPSFNDLYYERVGSSSLKPETAIQHNIGVIYGSTGSGFLQSFHFSADGYLNRIKDKIVAIPTQNLFIWSMVNLGKVEITGLDINGEFVFRVFKNNSIEAGVTYTFQNALDVTNPSSSVYKDQIAYTPKASGSGRFMWMNPIVNFGYSVVWSGKRYSMGDNVASNALDGYSDHSIQLEKDFKFRSLQYGVKAELLNILGHNYEVVKNFPMPGRSWRLTLLIHI